MEGLDIPEGAFLKMKSKERDLVLFRNVTHNRKKFKDYSFHKKINYIWLCIITIAVTGRKWIPF